MCVRLQRRGEGGLAVAYGVVFLLRVPAEVVLHAVRALPGAHDAAPLLHVSIQRERAGQQPVRAGPHRHHEPVSLPTFLLTFHLV